MALAFSISSLSRLDNWGLLATASSNADTFFMVFFTLLGFSISIIPATPFFFAFSSSSSLELLSSSSSLLLSSFWAAFPLLPAAPLTGFSSSLLLLLLTATLLLLGCLSPSPCCPSHWLLIFTLSL